MKLFTYLFIYLFVLIRGPTRPEERPLDRSFDPGMLRVEGVSQHSNLYLYPLNTTQYRMLSYELDGKFSVWSISSLIVLLVSILVEYESTYNRTE